jgi:hypothetical protein
MSTLADITGKSVVVAFSYHRCQRTPSGSARHRRLLSLPVTTCFFQKVDIGEFRMACDRRYEAI